MFSSVDRCYFHLIQWGFALDLFANSEISAHLNVARCNQNENKKIYTFFFLVFSLIFLDHER